MGEIDMLVFGLYHSLVDHEQICTIVVGLRFSARFYCHTIVLSVV